MSWADDLNKLVTKGGRDLEELSIAVKIGAFSGIVSDTRVDQGRLRGNWQIQEDGPASGELDRLDKTGEKVTREVEEKSTPDGITYFVNNLPYAAVWEERDGMVQRNVERVKANVKKMADSIR